MHEFMLKGIPVQFPFEPYPLQKDYMEGVIQCLQNESNGVLESPTGTGKTLCLLCSSLAWLQVKKAQVQAQRALIFNEEGNDFLKNLQGQLESDAGKGTVSPLASAFQRTPTIIYASRTHSQLSQAMQELKRTAYSHMKAVILGSREQMCIHPEVKKEKEFYAKILMCKAKTQSRSCHFYNRVEKMKGDPLITNLNIVDIEDIVKLGDTHKFCPYYMASELKKEADIVFMPYNYLLSERARKALSIEIGNSIVILDEAHNVEKQCEEFASLEIKSTDITLCIEEITAVMKRISEDNEMDIIVEEPDFNPDDLCILKQLFLDFEKELDAIQLQALTEGTVFDGDYIFEMLGKAGINDENGRRVIILLDKIILFLVTVSNSNGPSQRKGNGLQLFCDLLSLIYSELTQAFKDKIKKCCKVRIAMEEAKKKTASNWLSKSTAKSNCRVLSYWCFSPGFCMNNLIKQGVRCVILTSGTLAPLKPLISELELKVDVSLVNPHIVAGDQICVKIISKGPDGEQLKCTYHNRDNPKYINSLGQTILNLSRLIPDGLLVFFPSYPIMQKYQQIWQESGLWGHICDQKPIYVEPKDKEAFNTAMSEYYMKIQDPSSRGAILMGVCRGKVSEGVDFTDINGRAVIVVGLPYPPLMDPRVMLKKKYLDVCNAQDKEYLRGDDWYNLEAIRAVNQAIGRVIRHRHDYGAIVLLDSRFTSCTIQSRLSFWIQKHMKVVNNFGEIIRDLRSFYKNAELKLPLPKSSGLQRNVHGVNSPVTSAQFQQPSSCRKGNFLFSSSSIAESASSSGTSSSGASSSGMVNIYNIASNNTKKRKITLIPNPTTTTSESKIPETSTTEYIIMVRKQLDTETFKQFIEAMKHYKDHLELDALMKALDEIFLPRSNLRYIIQGIQSYIKPKHKEAFREYYERMKLL